MNKICSAIIVLYLLISTTCLSRELTIRVTDDAYAPYFFKHENNAYHGLSIELARALLDEANFRFCFVPMPFSRSLKYMKVGKIDMMLNLTITEERAGYIHFIGPQLDETVMMVIPKDLPVAINSLDDIKMFEKPIGIERGKVYGPAFEEKRRTDPGFEKMIEVVNALEINETKLAKGRITGFLGYGYSISHRLKTNPSYKNFSVHPYVFHRSWVYFGFSKKSVSKGMLQELQGAYDRIDKKQVLGKIRNRYRYQR